MIEPGIIINGKYFIIYEIGQGAFATVWISYDVIKNCYNAIKIHDRDRYEDGKAETKLLKKINNFKCDHINYLIENFAYNPEGSRINYMCTVFELMAGSLTVYWNMEFINMDYQSNVLKKFLNKC